MTSIQEETFIFFKFDPILRHRYDILNLYNSKFEEIKELDRCDYGPIVMDTMKKKKGTGRVFIFAVSNGVFLARVNMPAYGSWMYPGTKLNRPKVKNRYFYCIREKESGYKELVVCRMRWEN